MAPRQEVKPVFAKNTVLLVYRPYQVQNVYFDTRKTASFTE